MSDLRMIEVKGWPGGWRIIDGQRPKNCVHGKPLTASPNHTVKDPAAAREQLCRLCVYELARSSFRR